MTSVSEHRYKKRVKKKPWIPIGIGVGTVALVAVAVIIWVIRHHSDDDSTNQLSPEKLTYNKRPASLSELLERYAMAQGGPEKIAEVRSLRLHGDFVENGQHFTFNILKRVPKRSRMVIESDSVRIATFTDGKLVWRRLNDDPTAYQVTGDDAEYAKRNADILGPLWTHRNTKDVITQLPDEALEGVMHHVLKVEAPGQRADIFWIDAQTYWETQTISTNDAGEKVTTRYSDHRPVGWMTVPHRITVNVDGKPDKTFHIKQADLNVGVFESYFEPPLEMKSWPPESAPAN